MDNVSFEEENFNGPSRAPIASASKPFFLTRILIEKGVAKDAQAVSTVYVVLIILCVLISVGTFLVLGGSQTLTPSEIQKMAIPAE
ncbi:MAG TPA: hypothetical protein VIR98_03260 [Candidatus Paceibacterota bacterium]|jgi:hypothetical protein